MLKILGERIVLILFSWSVFRVQGSCYCFDGIEELSLRSQLNANFVDFLFQKNSVILRPLVIYTLLVTAFLFSPEMETPDGIQFCNSTAGASSLSCDTDLIAEARPIAYSFSSSDESTAAIVV